jgi:iron complex outermembrane receptor protein
MGKTGLILRLPALVALSAPAMAQETSTSGTMEMPTLMVQALSGGDIGLVPEQTSLGAKIDTPVEFIPQSISIVTEEALEQRDPQTLEEAIAYVPGIVPSPWGMDARFSQFLIRGFDVGTYGVFRDGLGQRVIGFSGFNIEPYTLERVEVLRGPNGVLYGETNPGGIVNAVTKRPTFEPLREGFLSYGSFNTVEGGFDLGGELGTGGTLAYRLTGFYRDGETSLENSQDDRILIAPALTWKPNDKTSFTLLTNFQRDKNSPGVYLPVAGVDYPDGPDSLPGWAWDTLPEGNHFDADTDSIGYILDHEIADGVVAHQNFRFMEQRTDYRDFYFNGMADDATMSYADFSVKETASIFALDNQVEFAFDLGAVRNTLLVGIDYYRSRANSDYGYDEDYRISVADPDFDFARPAPETYYNGVQVIEQVGIYLHDQAQLSDRLLASFGLRQAWVENTFDDNLFGDDSEQRDNKLVGDIGFVYELPNGVLPYASYSTGFVTNVGADFDGDLHKPTEAEQFEFGARYRPLSFDALFSASLFQITKTNVLTVDPDNLGFWVQTGEVRHRGLELEADITLSEGLSAVAAYTYIDAKITSSNDGDEGNIPAQVPEHAASLWANYDMPEGRFEGLSLGGGARYVGASFGDTSNTRETPAYTTFDAALRYARGAIEGAVNVTNLFDKDYYAICYSGGGCTKGAPRTVQATLSFAF